MITDSQYLSWKERDYRVRVIAMLTEQGCHVSSVESPDTCPGIPDLNVNAGGKEFWVELKMKNGYLRPTQRRWIKERLIVATNVYVMVFDADMVSIINAADMDLKEDLNHAMQFAHTVTTIDQLTWRMILK